MKAFLFSGQGSQGRGMGKRLFDQHRILIEQADEVLGYSVRDLCLDDPRRELNLTEFAQPAIYVVNALSYFDKCANAGNPDFVAGHSLGEFSALMAAECFDFVTGLTLVKELSALMSRMADGTMAAVLDAEVAHIERVLLDNRLDQIDIANFNAPTQTVISGPRQQIAKAQKLMHRGKTRFIPLGTQGAFHSRCMAPARAAFEPCLAQFTYRAPAIPVIASASGKPYGRDDLAANLGELVTGSVRWVDTIQHLLNAVGRERHCELEFVEVGNGDMLSKLAQTIRMHWLQDPDCPPASIEHIRRWNAQFPIGTKVRSAADPGKVLETRTEATLLFHHRAVVYLKGYNGYFDLNDLVPLPKLSARRASSTEQWQPEAQGV